jgi:hypothetical protein
MVAFATSPSPVSGVRAAAIANVADESAASREGEQREAAGIMRTRARGPAAKSALARVLSL